MLNFYDSDYKELVKNIIYRGREKTDRTGTGTKSLFGQQLRVDMRNGFPLLTIKDTHFKSVLHELMWMLDMVPDEYKKDVLPDGTRAGCTNIKYLVDNKVRIWNNWPHEKYVQQTGEAISVAEFGQRVADSDEFAQKYGDLGPVYGRQWRYWDDRIDQFKQVANRLTERPDDRRMLVSAWNPTHVPNQALPPCHLLYQVWTAPMTEEESEKYGDIYGKGNPKFFISLQFYMRSVDVILGLPFDIASYAIQLEMLARHANMVPLDLVAALGDTHIYLNHIDDNLLTMLTREGYTLPQLEIDPFEDLDDLRADNIRTVGYKCHPKLHFKIAV